MSTHAITGVSKQGPYFMAGEVHTVGLLQVRERLLAGFNYLSLSFASGQNPPFDAGGFLKMIFLLGDSSLSEI